MSDLIGVNNASVTSGARSLASVAAGRKVPQYTRDYVKLNANVAPLMALMEKLGQNKDVGQNTYFSLLADMLPQTVTQGASDSGTSTSIVLAGSGATGQGRYLAAGSILYVERTNESILVTAVDPDNVTLTVVRAYGTGSGSAAVILANEVIQIQGSAFGENSAAPSGLSVEPVILSNYLQTFRRSIEASGRDIQSENYGPKEWDRMRDDCADAIKLDEEKAFLFNPGGAAGAGTAADPGITQGLLGIIATNVFNQGGVLDEASLENYAIAWYRHNFGQGASMYSFIGDNVMRAIDGFARDSVRYTPKDEVLGLQIKGWQCSAGEFKLIHHGLLTPLGSVQTAANRGRAGFMIGVNMKMIGKATFKGRGMKYSDNIEVPGTDGKKAGFTDDVGLRVLSERAHMFAYGITNS